MTLSFLFAHFETGHKTSFSPWFYIGPRAKVALDRASDQETNIFYLFFEHRHSPFKSIQIRHIKKQQHSHTELVLSISIKVLL